MDQVPGPMSPVSMSSVQLYTRYILNVKEKDPINFNNFDN